MRAAGPFRTYAEVEAWLGRVTDYEKERSRYGPRQYNLDSMRTIAERLGRPETSFGSIHIAGTKGKGSTAIMAEALLRASGRRTGLYTSPHLVDMRERIRIDGEPVSRIQLVRSMERVRGCLRGLAPTYFELMTAAAFDLFRERGVERAVVEVGLGGRLDCTNILRPQVCVIAPIDLDHTDKLGTTLAEIAAEKAGILKPGVPCLVGPQRPAAGRVIFRTARKVGAPAWSFGRAIDASCRVRLGGRSMVVTARAGRRRFRFVMPFFGRHQACNAATAIAAAELSAGALDPRTVRRVFRSLALPGRFERIGGRTILDVAHNPFSARALAAALRESGWRDGVVVFGCSRDKDAGAMLRALAPFAREFVLTRAASARAEDPARLAELVPGGVPSRIVPSVAEALRAATGRMLVTGSFYVVGEARRRLIGSEGGRRMVGHG